MIINKKEKTKHLGRGLTSLLGPIAADTPHHTQSPTTPLSADFPPDKEVQESLREILIDQIQPNPYQPRTIWDEQELSELADSIKTNGIIQPIIVRPSKSGFELIAGERRFRAAKLAALPAIPALIRAATDEQLLELALVENIHRSNLNPIERAGAYQNYITSFSLTQTQAAERLGEDRTVIANHLRLLDLPTEIKDMLIKNQLSMGHARAILALPDNSLKQKLANRALAGRLSVREVERLVRKYLTLSEPVKKQTFYKLPHIQDLETKLTQQLGTKVNIETKKNGQKGKVIIEFYSLDEFDRIMEKIGLDTSDDVIDAV